MLKLILSSLLLFSVSLFADKGILQEHLVSLTPTVAQQDVDPNAHIQITFDSEIDEHKLKKNTLIVKNDKREVEGETTLSTDKQSIVFTPKTSMLMGPHSVKLLPLKLKGSEKQPCDNFWNHSKAFMNKNFGWFNNHICYEDAPIVSKLIKYSFSVADNTIKVTSLNITTKTTDLNESEIVPVTVTALFDDNTTQDVTEKVDWKSSNNSVAKVENSMIVALSEGSIQLTASYNGAVAEPLNIIVYKIVDNHRLPPEPDEKLNNSTLLGIDFNNNGIRDDVERLIILEEAKDPYFPKIHTAISLQFAWAWQKMIENPVVASREYLENSSACRQYFYNSRTEGLNFQDYLQWERQHPSMLGSKLQDQIFNTRLRIEKRFEFNAACEGKVFNLKPAVLDACRINIDELGE